MKEFFDRTRKQVIVIIEPDELLVVQPIGRGAVMRNDGRCKRWTTEQSKEKGC